MGHHLDTKESLVPLIDRLNKYPIGLFDNEKLRQILAIIFSEEEAYVASKFPLEESTLDELVRATGYQVDRLHPILESMADKGLVMDMEYNKQTYYLLMPGLIGFFELTFMKQRADLPVKELAQLMSDYLFNDPEQGMAREFMGSKTPLTRAMAYEEHIPVTSVITPYESARKIIEGSSFGAIGMCYCRHKKEHLGKSCDKEAPSSEICISLGTAAKFMVRRGFAEERSKEELLKIIELAREHQLTHVTDNIRHKPSFICNCCSCCCELMGGVQQGFYDGIAKANFTLEKDEERCNGCGLCTKACNIYALELVDHDGPRKKTVKVNKEMCLGCGACIESCPTDALSLVPHERPLPPMKKKDLFLQILKEKKRVRPFVVSRVVKKVRTFLPSFFHQS